MNAMIVENRSEFSGWYVIQTNPNCEIKAARWLRRNVHARVYQPRAAWERRNRRTGVRSYSYRPLLVGYLLVRFPRRILNAKGTPPFKDARACYGVKGFLYWTDRTGESVPLILRGKDVVELILRQRSAEFDYTERGAARRGEVKEAKYRRGSIMHVVDGAFAGFDTEIEAIEDNGSVRASVTIFGRPCVVRFEDPDNSLSPIGKQSEAA